MHVFTPGHPDHTLSYRNSHSWGHFKSNRISFCVMLTTCYKQSDSKVARSALIYRAPYTSSPPAVSRSFCNQWSGGKLTQKDGTGEKVFSWVSSQRVWNSWVGVEITDASWYSACGLKTGGKEEKRWQMSKYSLHGFWRAELIKAFHKYLP